MTVAHPETKLILNKKPLAFAHSISFAICPLQHLGIMKQRIPRRRQTKPARNPPCQAREQEQANTIRREVFGESPDGVGAFMHSTHLVRKLSVPFSAQPRVA